MEVREKGKYRNSPVTDLFAPAVFLAGLFALVSALSALLG